MKIAQNETLHSSTLELIEPTPKIYSKSCKVFTKLLSFSLTYFHYFFALIIWYMYDYFFAIAALLMSYIVIGIVRSKLRNSVIPLRQQEYHYSDSAIASWYMAHHVCLETQNKKSKEIV